MITAKETLLMDSIKAKEQFIYDEIAAFQAKIDAWEEDILTKIAEDPNEPVDILRQNIDDLK